MAVAVRPGGLMFTTIDGIGGKAVALAEKINDPIVTWADARRVQHVGVVTSETSLVQAMPGGAEEVPLYPGIYVRPPYLSEYTPPWVVDAARGYIDTPYSWLDYAAIAGRHTLALKPTSRTPFDRYVSATGHMICSQLADQAMADAGFHVFNDGRIPQDVTPAALFHALVNMPGTVVLSTC